MPKHPEPIVWLELLGFKAVEESDGNEVYTEYPHEDFPDLWVFDDSKTKPKDRSASPMQLPYAIDNGGEYLEFKNKNALRKAIVEILTERRMEVPPIFPEWSWKKSTFDNWMWARHMVGSNELVVWYNKNDKNKGPTLNAGIYEERWKDGNRPLTLVYAHDMLAGVSWVLEALDGKLPERYEE